MVKKLLALTAIAGLTFLIFFYTPHSAEKPAGIEQIRENLQENPGDKYGYILIAAAIVVAALCWLIPTKQKQ